MKKNSLKIISGVITTVMLGIALSSPLVAAPYAMTQLTDNDYDDVNPQINNSGYVFWLRHDENYTHEGRKYYLYDGSTITQLPFTSGESNLLMNNNGNICLNKFDDGIYIYNINSGTTTKVEDNGMPIDFNDQDYVLWYEGTPFYGNLRLYDGSTTIQITNDSSYKWHAKLDNNGNVAWYGGTSPPIDNLEIFLYDGMTTTQLTTNNYGDQFPNIGNGNVVWTGFPSPDGDGEIFVYDGSATSQITDNVYCDQNPEINNNGWAVWEGHDPDAEIFLYDGKTTAQITDNDNHDTNPKINNNGDVAWYGQHGIYTDVYIYNGSAVTQLIDSNYDIGGNQQINDNGDVVWYGREVFHEIIDGEDVISYADYEIFLASPEWQAMVTTDLDHIIDMALQDTFNFDYWWEMGQEPEGFNLDVLFFRDGEWKFVGWEVNLNGSSAEWETASFSVPTWARGLETQIMFRVFDFGEYTDPTVYLRNISSQPVPEPATILLLGCGLIGLAAFRRKFRKR